MSLTQSNLTEAAAGTFVGQKYTVNWTSDSSGNATELIRAMQGFLIAVDFEPSSVAAPSADYDVTLVDSDGLDLLGGAGVDRSASAKSRIPTPNSGTTLITYLYGDYTLTIANAGNTKQGTVTLFVRG